MSARSSIILVRAIIIFLACGSVLYARRRKLDRTQTTYRLEVKNSTDKKFEVEGPRGFRGVVEPAQSITIYTDDLKTCEHQRTRWVTVLRLFEDSTDVGLLEKPWEHEIKFFTPKTCLTSDYIYVVEPSRDKHEKFRIMRER